MGKVRITIRAVVAAVAALTCLFFSSMGAYGSPASRSADPGTAISAPSGFVCTGGFKGGNGDLSGPHAPRVTAVRVGHHGDYDRFVIQVSGTVMPSYRVTHHSTTFPLGTGTVKLKGTHGILVRLFPVNSSSYHGPSRIRPRFPVLKEARMIEYFEGHMNWWLGIKGTPCLRVAVFSSPIRLVVDIATK